MEKYHFQLKDAGSEQKPRLQMPQARDDWIVFPETPSGKATAVAAAAAHGKGKMTVLHAPKIIQ